MGRRHYRVTFADAIAAHQEALVVKGAPGILSEAGLLSAIDRPYSGYHKRIHEKAAALVEAVTRNHGFLDGNKRTAVALAILMIHRSGYLLEASDDEIEEMVVAAATGELRLEALKAWFKRRILRPEDVFPPLD